jgi:hypothetical protein
MTGRGCSPDALRRRRLALTSHLIGEREKHQAARGSVGLGEPPPHGAAAHGEGDIEDGGISRDPSTLD